MRIFIAKLNFDTQDQDLFDAFEPFGEVTSANVVMDKFTKRSRGFGFVEMDKEEEALKAIDELNDTELHRRVIVVKKANPRREDSAPNKRW